MDKALVDATPLTAVAILYAGPQADDFIAAVQARNPQAQVAVFGPGVTGAFQAVVVDGAPAPALLNLLTADGVLVAREAPEGFQIISNAKGVVRSRRPGSPPPPPLRLNVVIFASTLMDIRTRLPVQALASEVDIVAESSHSTLTLPAVVPGQPRVLVMQRPRATDLATWLQWATVAIANGWMLVLEYDDHPQIVANVRGVTLTDADWLRYGWVHAIQTSTPRLAELFGRYNPEVKVFPNAVFDLAPFPEAPKPARIFYGGVSRGAFAVETARSLAPALAAHPQAEVVVVGDQAVFDAVPTRAKTFHPLLSYEDYLALMASCSISLSPLEARPMIDTKSDAKYLDASRAGLLTIASPTVYADTIRDGVTGLIAHGSEDWSRLLGKALDDPAWARGIARAAWEDVRGHRMFAHQVAARRDWYRGLWMRRNDLNKGLMARLPGLDAAVRARLQARQG